MQATKCSELNLSYFVLPTKQKHRTQYTKSSFLSVIFLQFLAIQNENRKIDVMGTIKTVDEEAIYTISTKPIQPLI